MNKTIFISIGIAIILFAGVYVFSRQMQSPQNTQTRTPQQESSDKTVNISKECSGEVVPALTEGPYYTAGSPERKNIVDGAPGEGLTITGYVFNEQCEPVPGAWIDFWQTDGEGNYDNSGYTLRGHQYTDESGKYILETVIPGEYPGRTAHIHLKIRATEQSSVITSQLFIPGVAGNESDSIFNEQLIVTMSDEYNAIYNFVIPSE